MPGRGCAPVRIHSRPLAFIRGAPAGRTAPGPLICDQGSKKPCAAPCREAALRSAFIRVHWRSFAVAHLLLIVPTIKAAAAQEWPRRLLRGPKRQSLRPWNSSA